MADLTSTSATTEVSLSSAAQTKQTASAEQTQQAQKSEPEFATKSDLTAILKRLDGISAGLDKVSKRVPEKIVEASTSTTDPVQKKLDEFETWKKQIETEKAEFKQEKGIDKVEKALAKRGVEAEMAPRFAKLFWDENKANLVVEDKTYNVSYKHSETEISPIETFLDLYIQTDAGKGFLPTKLNPKSEGLTGNGTIKKNGPVQIVERNGSFVPQGVDPADIRKGKVVIK
jgi:hypothetical protein